MSRRAEWATVPEAVKAHPRVFKSPAALYGLLDRASRRVRINECTDADLELLQAVSRPPGSRRVLVDLARLNDWLESGRGRDSADRCAE